MGLFDLSKGSGVGFVKIKNTQNFTNQDLLDKLSGIKVSFGEPQMGDIKGTQSVMYKKVSEKFDVFVRVDGSNVIMGKIGTDGVSSVGTAISMMVDMFAFDGAKDEGTSKADRAVDELGEIIKKLEAGEAVKESNVTASVNTSTGSAIAYFMDQKILSINPKFDIYTEQHEPVYHVDGNITRLDFKVKNSAGAEVAEIKKKLIAILPEFTILQNGSEIGKLKKKLKLTSPELVGTLNGQEFKLQGDLMGFNFDVMLGGKCIGRIDTAQTIWADCYRIQILDEGYKDLMIAIAVICDNVVDSSNS
jgi:uncharacterized protein YxjI